MTADLAPHVQRSVSTSGRIRYRNARFGLDDLQEIVEQCGAVERQDWLCSQADRAQVQVEGQKKPASYEVLREYHASTLAELVELAPKGKIYHLEAAFELADGHQLALVIGEPRTKTYWTKLTLTGPNADLPVEYHRVATLLWRRERRGARRRDLGTLMAASFLTPPLLLLLVAWQAVSRVPQSTTAVSIFTGVVLAALYVPTFVPIGLGLARWLAASSVTLKPKFDSRSFKTKLRQGWQSFKSVYSRNGDLEYKAYLVGLGGMVFGLLGLVIAILTWLYPVK